MTTKSKESLPKNNVNNNVLLFSGYARLPSGTASSEVYVVMALVVSVDMQTGIIIEAECTLSTRLAERFVSGLLEGKSLKDGPQELVDLINRVYQGNAKKSIISAIRIVADKYLAFSKEQHSYI